MLDQLKNPNRIVGIKQVTKAVEGRTVKAVFVATDSDPKMIGDMKTLCSEHQIEIIYVESRKHLGKACGIDVGASVAALPV